MRSAAAVVAGAVALALVLGGCTGGAASDDPDPAATQSATLPAGVQKDLRGAVKDALAASGASGAIVGVWAPWSGSLTEATGTTERGGDTPMSVDMSFRVGDLTKSMTCTALLREVDAGHLKLDDQVSRYLPRVVGVAGITLRRLCQSTAGIQPYQSAVRAQFVNNPERPWPAMELISDAISESHADSDDHPYTANDGGYMLLGLALQRATGKDPRKLFEKDVFRPAGMHDSSLPGPDQLGFAGAHPHGYARPLDESAQPVCSEKTVDVTRWSGSAGWTAAGAVSTLTDLRAYVHALATGSLLQPATRKELWTAVPMGDAPSWQGFGLGAAKYGPMRGGAGAAPGFITAALSDPATGLTVVVMLNDSQSGADFALDLAMQLTSIAAKAPARHGASRPTIALPWSAKQAADALQSATVCPPKKAEKKK